MSERRIDPEGRNYIASWISRIYEPRDVTFVVWLTYVGSAIGGLLTFQNPPQMAIATDGILSTHIWSSFLLIGGILGASVVLRGVFWLERIALLLCFSGIGIYFIVTLNIHLTTDNVRFAHLSSLFPAAMFYVNRLVRIRGLRYDPLITAERKQRKDKKKPLVDEDN